MATVCMNPAGERHKIATGDRLITLTTVVVWGKDDLRDDWQGDYTFCCFKCLEGWAAEKASEHDGQVRKDGND